MGEQRTARLAFRIVCLLFSLALALLTLRSGIALTQQAERIALLQQEQQSLQEENERLRVRSSCAIGLEELEDYALRVLGMQACRSDQVYVIHWEDKEPG